MGIDLWNFQFLLEAHRRCGPFGRTLQIGRQEIHMGEDCYPFADRLLKDYGFETSFADARRGTRWVDESLMALFGATEVQTADASSYEGANIVHDFNDPIDKGLHQQFDTLFDGGSLEHIFNVPGALTNEMYLVKTGGHLLSSIPANNWLGHGFYQFSQEFPFRTMHRGNGFELKGAFFSEMTDDHSLRSIDDLARRAGGEIGTTKTNTGLMFIARKTDHVVPFRRWPQQGDYNSEWERFDAANQGAATIAPSAGAAGSGNGLLARAKRRLRRSRR